MSFAENLQYLRKKNKITQESLADELNVSRQSVSKWETGEAYPETDKLILLCDKFSITLDELVRGDVTNQNINESKIVNSAIQNEDNNKDKDNRKEMTIIEKDAFNRYIGRFSFFISLGVFLILLGVAFLVAISAFAERNTIYSNILGAVGASVLLVLIAIAVFIFIYFGINHGEFMRSNADKKVTYTLEERNKFMKNSAIGIGAMVALILLDVVMLIVLTSIFYADENNTIVVGNNDFYAILTVALFLFLLAFAVFGLVSIGIKQTLRFPETQSKNTDSKIISIIMSGATIIFLFCGFVFNKWHPAWVVFPIGGIACGIVESCNRLKKDK